MKLSDICIQRPVFATVLSFVVLLLGLVAYDRLSVREYPNIDPPVVNVETTYPGASAQIMESQITQILEDSLSGIEGIDYITSISRQQQSHKTEGKGVPRDVSGPHGPRRTATGAVSSPCVHVSETPRCGQWALRLR